MNSLTFAWRNSKSGFSLSALTLSREPVMKLSSARTRMPRFSKASHRCEPMKPAPPETTARSLVAALQAFPELVDYEHPLVAVDVHDGVEQLGVIVEALGQCRQRLHIFGKAVVRDQAAGRDERMDAWDLQGVDRS